MFRRIYRFLTESKPHPVTGDMLSPTERVLWAVTGQYRKLRWFVALQVLTVIWWLFPRHFPGGLPGWNYLWSDLAVVVEQMVGIIFLQQMFRDAVIIRQELQTLRQDTALLHEIAAAVLQEKPQS